MVITYDLKPMIIKVAEGISAGVTTVEHRHMSSLPNFIQFKIRVALPPKKQMTKEHDGLAKRVDDDWKDELVWFPCSTGNFREAIYAGEVNLGHLVGEMYSHCLYRVMGSFRKSRMAKFNEYFEIDEENETSTTYHIWIFTVEPIPEEFSSLMELVVGYTNALVENKPFPIHDRLTNFIHHRGVPIPEEKENET